MSEKKTPAKSDGKKQSRKCWKRCVPKFATSIANILICRFQKERQRTGSWKRAAHATLAR